MTGTSHRKHFLLSADYLCTPNFVRFTHRQIERFLKGARIYVDTTTVSELNAIASRTDTFRGVYASHALRFLRDFSRCSKEFFGTKISIISSCHDPEFQQINQKALKEHAGDDITYVTNNPAHAILMERNQIPTVPYNVEIVPYTGYRHLLLLKSDLDSWLGKRTININPRKAFWRNLHPLTTNEFVILDNDLPLGHSSRIGRFVSPGKIIPIFGPDEQPIASGIHARSPIQEIIMSMFLNDSYLNIVNADAGVGKTLLALATAFEQKRSGKYSRIIFVPPEYMLGKDHGAVPGDMYAKLTQYLSGFNDALATIEKASGKFIAPTANNEIAEFLARLEELAKSHHDTTSQELKKKIDRAIRKLKIPSPQSRPTDPRKPGDRIRSDFEVIPINQALGSSPANTIIIIDEAQYLKPQQLYLLTTRAATVSSPHYGKQGASKVILIGDDNQLDPFSRTGVDQNGITLACQYFRDKHLAEQITVRDATFVERGAGTKMVVGAYRKSFADIAISAAG